MGVKVEEIHQGWVRITEGKAGVTVSPRGIIHPAKIYHGEEGDLVACIRAAQSYIKRNIKTYKKRLASPTERLGW
jgi:hypothetical protein